ncbi:hypothetical protein FI667_g1593, partial [Globisporangium splendens]
MYVAAFDAIHRLGYCMICLPRLKRTKIEDTQLARLHVIKQSTWWTGTDMVCTSWTADAFQSRGAVAAASRHNIPQVATVGQERRHRELELQVQSQQLQVLIRDDDDSIPSKRTYQNFHITSSRFAKKREALRLHHSHIHK